MEHGAKVCGVRLRTQINRDPKEDVAERHPKTHRTELTALIKRESSDEEFKEYAETAMNELLGWYGYANNNNNNKAPHRRQQHSNGGGEEPDKTDHEPPERRSSGHSSGSDSPKSADICGWCAKAVDDSTGLSSNEAVFCSELCFSQSRRANFKKNKTCDWCKHVRHTVSYVDFQDGASQLQFCSDKCLNQYKMHIFCRETRAHLEMHPHLLTEDTTSGLITPDLWMRNCRSPSSRASSPGHTRSVAMDEPQTSPLPLITVAHPSKLLSIVPSVMAEKNVPHSRRKRLRKRPNLALHKTPPEVVQAQDLRVRRLPNAHTPFPETISNNREFPELASRLSAPNGGINGNANIQPIRFNGSSGLSNLAPSDQGLRHLPPAPPQPQNLPLPFPRTSLLPPVTMMVPYPVILPIPIPIPIPLPITAFLQAANIRNRMQTQQNGGSTAPAQNGNGNGHVCPEGQQEANSAKTHSDEEEIVVDDDSRLNQQHEINGNENGNGSGSPIAERSDDQQQFVPNRLRKRKPADNNPDVRITQNVNYKHKKPLSV